MPDKAIDAYKGESKVLVDVGDGTFAERIAAVKGNQLVSAVVISSGQTVSAAIDLGVYRAVGLSMPSAFTGTTLKFQSSFDGTNFLPVYKDGVEVSETVGTSRRVVLDPAKFYGIRYLRLVSNQAELADRSINVIAEA